MIDSMPSVDTVIVPTSGGGLIGGIALAIKAQKPNVNIIAVSMMRGPSLYESLKAGKPVDVVEEATLADALHYKFTIHRAGKKFLSAGV